MQNRLYIESRELFFKQMGEQELDEGGNKGMDQKKKNDENKVFANGNRTKSRKAPERRKSQWCTNK